MPYVEGKYTVLANATKGILNLPLPIRGKGGLALNKGEAIDIEKAMSKEAIRNWLSELERIEGLGYIKWFTVGTVPTLSQTVPKLTWVPNRIGSTVAPPNQFDKKLNTLLDEEKKRDERTLPGDLGRVTDESYSRLSNVDAAEARVQAQKEAELSRKEEELAAREMAIAEREEKASRRGRRSREKKEGPEPGDPVDPSVDDGTTAVIGGPGNSDTP